MPIRKLSAAIAAVLATSSVSADHMEELVVTASHDKRVVEVGDALSISPDVAELLKKAPGVDVNRNGPLTGLPQYRGMYGARISTTIDGMQLSSAGPNAMDPPLSYAATGQLQSLVLYRGIAPVSAAQESVGGVVEAISDRGQFTTAGNPDDFEFYGSVMGNIQSVNEGTHLNGSLFASNANHRFKLAALTEQGDDAAFPDGDILPSEYERQRYDMGYGFTTGAHTLQVDYVYNDTGDTGTPALPMDIEIIEGDLYRLNYLFDGARDMRIDTTVFASELDHTMTNFHLRGAPPPPRWRRNTADSSNVGFSWRATLGDDTEGWRVGIDGLQSEHNSDIDNPNNAMFFVENFNDAQRDIYGLYIERNQPLGDALNVELGLRYNRVSMDAKEVDGTPAMMMPPAAALRDAFNAADRNVTDDNFDLAAKSWFTVSESTSLYLGIARKTRSPSYQERYLWLPLEATGGLADGRLYTGNIDLDPEVSRQIEVGMDFSGAAITIAPRLFYYDVKDYIQGTPSELVPAGMFVSMMNRMNSTNNAAPLRFNNVDATLYGFDVDWHWQLSDHWAVSGLLNYVRGERDDINDNLYRIAPPNATARLHYRSRQWSAQAEAVAYAEQDDISATNSELSSDSYEVINVAFDWRATEVLQLSLGVDNLLDEEYAPHLGGYNRAANPDVPLRDRLPAPGINAYARVTYSF